MPPHVPVFLVSEENRRREEPPIEDAVHEEPPPPDGPFWEIPHDDEPAALPYEEFVNEEDAPPPPVASRKTLLLWGILIGAALLVWTAVAWKALDLRRENQAVSIPVITQKRRNPVILPTPATVRHRAAPPQRRVIVARKHPKRVVRRRPQEKHSVILGRGTVLEDDKSIIRIHD